MPFFIVELEDTTSRVFCSSEDAQLYRAANGNKGAILQFVTANELDRYKKRKNSIHQSNVKKRTTITKSDGTYDMTGVSKKYQSIQDVIADLTNGTEVYLDGVTFREVSDDIVLTQLLESRGCAIRQSSIADYIVPIMQNYGR